MTGSEKETMVSSLYLTSLYAKKKSCFYFCLVRFQKLNLNYLSGLDKFFNIEMKKKARKGYFHRSQLNIELCPHKILVTFFPCNN